MTPDTNAAARSALSELLTPLGLEIEESYAEPGLASVAGPLLTLEVRDGDGQLDRCVAVRDTMGADAETLLADLGAAVADGGAVADGAPVATAVEIVARFDRPYEIAALTDGTEVQGLIITAIDRRGGSGSDPGTAGSGPVTADGPGTDPTMGAVGGFDKLVNVALDVSVELGRTRVTLSEVLDFDVGSVVELDRPAGAPVDVRVNGMLLAQGEVVLVDDEYAVRITAIVDPRTER